MGLTRTAADTTVRLPRRDGTLSDYRVRGSEVLEPPPAPFTSRVAFAAAHVVADPLADNTPGQPARLDWQATLAYRRHLWRYGFGVAEAMDTAQRGMGLDWAGARELIRRSAAEAAATGGAIACGAGTDHLPAAAGLSLDDVVHAYEEQCAFVEEQGAPIILMASRALAAVARGPEDYAAVYGRILRQVKRPVILHWLGAMFDPALAGYWGATDLDAATDHCLAVIHAHADKVDGVKVSLLDAAREAAMRRRLPAGVRMYTGDDFHYPELIRGDEPGGPDQGGPEQGGRTQRDEHAYSHALLGIFDAIAPVAAAALTALDLGDLERYERLLSPTVALSRHVFERPTYFYKTGIVFLAYLNGHQDHFRLVAGQESGRSLPHLAELLVLADAAGLIGDAGLAARRMRGVLALGGLR